MTIAPWLCVLLAVAQQHPLGLSSRDGVLFRDGVPYRGIGVNYFDAFARTLKDPNDTSYDAGFRVLAEHKIPFARFMCTGFWPAEMKLYRQDKQAYFKRLDGVVLSAQRHGIGLIPSLFWYLPMAPDLVGEPCDQWGNPQSTTHEFMRTYVREVVTRYQDSPGQFAEMLDGDNPDPVDTISVHIYAEAADRLAEALRVASNSSKPLFVGEFGDPGESPETKERFTSLLRRVEELEVPLAALWVFDYAGQTEWSVRQDNSRGYQLRAIAEANERIRRTPEVSTADARAGDYRARRESILKRDPKTRKVSEIPAKDKRLRVIIDSDARNEIDDVWAIALAILSPERFKIEGFVAANFDNSQPDAGPDSIEASRKEIEIILEKAGMAGRYPVLRGSPPLRYQYEPSESEGVDFIIEKAMASTADDPLWVVGLGAATDIASAYLKEPRIAERTIVFWHFRTRWPEQCWNFNVIGDVRAARTVFHSDLAFVLFDTGTHLYCPMNESQQFTSYGELGKYLHQFRYESPWYQKSDKGFYDLGDIAALIDPNLASWEVAPCPEVDWDLSYKFRGTKGSILRCHGIDRDRTFELFNRKLRTLSR